VTKQSLKKESIYSFHGLGESKNLDFLLLGIGLLIHFADYPEQKC
jgi:hypothetical protein